MGGVSRAPRNRRSAVQACYIGRVGLWAQPQSAVGLRLRINRASYGALPRPDSGTPCECEGQRRDPARTRADSGRRVPVVEIISGPQDGTAVGTGASVSAAIQHARGSRLRRRRISHAAPSSAAAPRVDVVRWIQRHRLSPHGTHWARTAQRCVGLHRQRTDASARVSRALTSAIADTPGSSHAQHAAMRTARACRNERGS